MTSNRVYTDNTVQAPCRFFRVFFRDNVNREFFRKVEATNAPHAVFKAMRDDRAAGGREIYYIRIEECEI